MSFDASHLTGLNLFPSSSAYESTQLSDAELAQTLALWTNVNFDYDDGGVGINSGQKLFEDVPLLEGEGEGRAQGREAGKKDSSASSSASNPFGIDYTDLLPQQHIQQQQQQQQPQQIVHSEHDPLDPFGFITSITSSTPSSAADHLFPHPLPSNFPSYDSALPSSYSNSPVDLTATSAAPTPASSQQRPAKRRASTRASAVASSSSVSFAFTPAATPAPVDEENVSVEDDKRRRNTAASARFRQKKKEREQALEKNSKELQARCALLEREVESLRQENTWLKGLVVGGSGSGSTAIPEPPVSSVGAPTGIDVGAGQKRKRDEEIADLFRGLI